MALSILTGAASPAQLSIVDLDSPEGRQSYLALEGNIRWGCDGWRRILPEISSDTCMASAA